MNFDSWSQATGLDHWGPCLARSDPAKIPLSSMSTERQQLKSLWFKIQILSCLDMTGKPPTFSSLICLSMHWIYAEVRGHLLWKMWRCLFFFRCNRPLLLPEVWSPSEFVWPCEGWMHGHSKPLREVGSKPCSAGEPRHPNVMFHGPSLCMLWSSKLYATCKTWWNIS